jgi:hypothetical protein
LTLLGEAQTLPVQLRLLALQEVSPSPSCATVLELSTRLALFDRPGRRDTIRGVYERYTRLPPRERAEARIQAPPAALTAPARYPWWLSRKVQAVAAAAVFVAAAGLGLMWLRSAVAAPPAGQEDRRGPVAKAVAEAGETVATGAAGTVKSAAEWLGLAPTDRPTATPAAEVSAPAGAVTPRKARSRKPPLVTPSGSRVADAAEPSGPDTTIYSAVDTEVVPPALQRSRLPAVPRTATTPDSIPQVEVVVSTKGEVESVKLVTQPTGVLPAMMLSAIKAWRFQPATLDGQPVRYRLVVRLTNQ